jgi:hypothetical protein
MDELAIERLGGIAGFGPSARIRSRGRISMQTLSDDDKAAVEHLFKTGGAQATTSSADAFRYQITRQTSAGPQSVEVAEHAVPKALVESVRDEIT